MPLPALLYGWLSGHGIWYPVNLLAGMVLPGIGSMTEAQLEQFSMPLLLTGLVIHALMAVVIGLIYGVLLPTLPALPGAVAWGGLLMPVLWTGITWCLMGVVDPLLHQGVNWPWFIISQFIFGVVAAAVVTRAKNLRPIPAGFLGGAVGGLLMPLPALLWSVANGHGIWYPVNLLAGMVVPGMSNLSMAELSGVSRGLAGYRNGHPRQPLPWLRCPLRLPPDQIARRSPAPWPGVACSFPCFGRVAATASWESSTLSFRNAWIGPGSSFANSCSARSRSWWTVRRKYTSRPRAMDRNFRQGDKVKEGIWER